MLYQLSIDGDTKSSEGEEVYYETVEDLNEDLAYWLTIFPSSIFQTIQVETAS